MRLASRSLVILVASLWLAGPLLAQESKGDPAVTKDAVAVKQLFETKFPGASVGAASKSPYFGLYELMVDDRMLYTDAKVTYVMVGSVFDASTKANLTDQRYRKLTRVAIETLPLDLAMKKVKGDGSRTLVVFADADCPYCKRLETELKGLDNVTIYTFLFPIDQLHPDSARKSAAIWCAPDKVKAWDDWFDSGKVPDNKGECTTPLAQTAELGKKLRITATPTLVFADGSMIPGALPLDRLQAEMLTAETEAKKLAALKK